MSARVYLNGRVLDEAEACVPVDDRAVLFGEAVFETLRTAGGKPFLLQKHLERLKNAAAALGFELREDESQIARAIDALTTQNGPGDHRVRITLTGGRAKGIAPDGIRPGTLIITTRPLVINTEPRRAVFFPAPRAPTPTLARTKNANYLASIEALRFARKLGADEAVFTRDEEVLESATANVFAVVGRRIFTPPVDAGVLPGITREFILKLAASNGIEAMEKPISKRELLSADEAFLTNAIVGIARIEQLEERAFPKEPGDVLGLLEKLYRDAMDKASQGGPS